MNKTEPERLLSVAEVADRLGLSQRTVRAYAANGRLPLVRLSRRCVRIRETDLARLVEAAADRPTRFGPRSGRA